MSYEVRDSDGGWAPMGAGDMPAPAATPRRKASVEPVSRPAAPPVSYDKRGANIGWAVLGGIVVVVIGILPWVVRTFSFLADVIGDRRMELMTQTPLLPLSEDSALALGGILVVPGILAAGLWLLLWRKAARGNAARWVLSATVAVLQVLLIAQSASGLDSYFGRYIGGSASKEGASALVALCLVFAAGAQLIFWLVASRSSGRRCLGLLLCIWPVVWWAYAWGTLEMPSTTEYPGRAVRDWVYSLLPSVLLGLALGAVGWRRPRWGLYWLLGAVVVWLGGVMSATFAVAAMSFSALSNPEMWSNPMVQEAFVAMLRYPRGLLYTALGLAFGIVVCAVAAPIRKSLQAERESSA